MSGQPSKTQAQANKFRNDYMETLKLQEDINDMNLQANKTYLLTGQLPPQSQLQDTRTNAEKLADTEKLKRDIADALKPIAEPAFAYQIVNAVQGSPLNYNNSLIRFLAQRVSSIAESVGKIMPYGIAGDENDLVTIVEFIKNMYSEQQGKFQSTKSFINSNNSSMRNSKIISANDIDSIINELQEVVKNIEIIIQRGSLLGLSPSLSKAKEIQKSILDLKHVLPSTEQISLLLQDIEAPSTIAGDIPYSRNDLEAFFSLMEKLPKYTEVMALIRKIKQYLAGKNKNIIEDGITRLQNMFTSIEGFGDLTILEQFKNIKNRQAYKQEQNKRLQTEQTRNFIENQAEEDKRISKANKVYVINPSTDPVNVTGALPGGPINVAPQPTPQPIATTFEPRVASVRNTGNFSDIALQARTKRIEQLINRLTPAELDEIYQRIGNPLLYHVEDLADYLANSQYNIGDYGIGGMGIKKRRGRPRGSGMPKPIIEKIPNFVGFGINEVNQKQLQKGIFKIRRGTRTNYPDMPSRRISSNLQNIIKTIIGGGAPKYEEFGKLDNEEKEYLYKIVSRSNLEDRLSVPAPSKDQQEKDIHNFEVMKGQIMSGNDSLELVKKFKLLTRKLSKQGLLPKADVDDILDTLTDLGY